MLLNTLFLQTKLSTSKTKMNTYHVGLSQCRTFMSLNLRRPGVETDNPSELPSWLGSKSSKSNGNIAVSSGTVEPRGQDEVSREAGGKVV